MTASSIIQHRLEQSMGRTNKLRNQSWGVNENSSAGPFVIVPSLGASTHGGGEGRRVLWGMWSTTAASF